MGRVVGVLVLVSSVAFALRVFGELRVFATPDGNQVVAFGADAGTSSFTIQNVGLATVTVSSVSLLGDDAGVFSLGRSPASLPVGESAQVAVNFQPAIPGSYSARVVIVSDETQGRNSDLVVCAPAPCDPPQPPPLPAPQQPAGCSSVGWLAPALALFLARRPQPAR